MLWTNYRQQDFTERSYSLIPEGAHRVRIENAQEKVSRSGRNMIELTLDVSGYSSKLWSYIVLDDSSEDAVKRTNRTLGAVFNSFNIEQQEDSDIDLSSWIGKTGGAMVRHRTDYSGKKRAEVHYFLYRENVDALPAWQENSSHQRTAEAYNLNPAEIPF